MKVSIASWHGNAAQGEGRGGLVVRQKTESGPLNLHFYPSIGG